MISKFNNNALSCLLTGLILFFMSVNVSAQVLAPVNDGSFTVSDIRLEGLQRISPTNVFALLNINVGDRLTPQDHANIIRDIASSENFDEVELLREDNVLIIRLKERPQLLTFRWKATSLFLPRH